SGCVRFRRVEEVDATVERNLHALERDVLSHLGAVRYPPAERDRRNLEAAVAEVAVFHGALVRGQTANDSAFHSMPSSPGGAMSPTSADDTTTAGLARYPSPPRPMRLVQLRLNDVMARSPFVSASGPCPKHGPHHESRISAPSARNTAATESPA